MLSFFNNGFFFCLKFLQPTTSMLSFIFCAEQNVATPTLKTKDAITFGRISHNRLIGRGYNIGKVATGILPSGGLPVPFAEKLVRFISNESGAKSHAKSKRCAIK